MDPNPIKELLPFFICLLSPNLIALIVVIRKPEIITQNLKHKISAFLIGLILWGIAIALMAQGNGAGSQGIRPVGVTVGSILALVLFVFAMLGWDTFPVGGWGGLQLKIFAIVAVAALNLVGYILIAYWTENRVLRFTKAGDYPRPASETR